MIGCNKAGARTVSANVLDLQNGLGIGLFLLSKIVIEMCLLRNYYWTEHLIVAYVGASWASFSQRKIVDLITVHIIGKKVRKFQMFPFRNCSFNFCRVLIMHSTELCYRYVGWSCSIHPCLKSRLSYTKNYRIFQENVNQWHAFS